MPTTAQHWSKILFFALLAYAVGGLLSDALARDLFSVGNSFTCRNGSPQGALLQISPCAGSPEDDKVFSYFICRYEQILSEAMGKVYCSVLWEMTPVVQAALTLLIALTGVSFLIGLTPFTAKELAVLGAKFCLVLAFATNSEYMIGYGYALFVALAKEGIVIVLDYLFTLPTITNFQDIVNIQTGNQVYSVFDKALADILGAATANEGAEAANRCQNSIFAMLVILAAAVPPLAFIVMYFLFRLLWMVIRAVFGYCQGLLGITFLTVLSPIYVSFALFKPTRTLFDKWVKYMISYGFQMVIVFAFIGMLFFILKQVSDDFEAYMALVQPINQAIEPAPGIINPISACGICKMEETDIKGKPKCLCDREGTDSDGNTICEELSGVLPISEVSKNKEFMEFTAVKGLAMVLLFYILDIMIGFVPEMASHLAGHKYAGQLGGGKSNSGQAPGNLRLPGEEAIGGALGAGAQSFMQSRNSAEGVVRGVYAAGKHAVTGQGGVLDTAIRSVANPSDPNRDIREIDNSAAGNLFGAAAGLTGAAALAKGYMGSGGGDGASNAPASEVNTAAQEQAAQQQQETANTGLAAQIQNDIKALGDNPTQADIQRVMAQVAADPKARAAAAAAVIESGELSAEAANALKAYTTS